MLCSSARFMWSINYHSCFFDAIYNKWSPPTSYIHDGCGVHDANHDRYSYRPTNNMGSGAGHNITIISQLLELRGGIEPPFAQLFGIIIHNELL